MRGVLRLGPRVHVRGGVVSARIECLDDNESITLRVTSTVGESGIDVSTDGSSDADDGVRIECSVARTSDGSTRVDWTILALGMTLTDALAGGKPRWLECPDLVQTSRCGSRSAAGEDALDRLIPDWRDGLRDAEHQLAIEATAGYDEDGNDLHDGDEAWMAALDRRATEVRWFAQFEAAP